MKRIVFVFLILVVLVPVGFYTKLYIGPAKNWINDSLGGVFYELFWMLLLWLFFPKISIIKNAIIVFLYTSILEFLQLWHPPFLNSLRSHFIGVTILGNSFVPSDFFYYLFGCIIGYFVLTYLARISKS